MQLSSHSTRNLAIGIIAAGVFLALASVWNDSMIIDEDPHIGAGYSYLAKQDMRLNPEHPPLAKDLAAIPLLFLGINQNAFLSTYWLNNVNSQWDFGRRIIYGSGVSPDLIVHAAKIPMLIFYILAGWIIFRWTRERYGDRASLLALVLFAFSPTIMAHARFVTTDVPALFGILLATYFFVNYLKNPSRKYFWFASCTFGVALLLKFSTILLIPFFLILTLLHGWKVLGKTILIMTVGFAVVVWPVYYFHVYNYPPSRQYHDTKDLLSSFGNRTLANPIIWASNKPIIRSAAQYGLGLLMVVQRSAGGNTVYFRGNVLLTAGPSYFPYVYMIKEPLAWLALLFIAVALAVAKLKIQKPNLKEHFDEIAMLLWLVIYWGVSIHSTLNIGVRHLLPVYPFMIMLVAGQVSKLQRKYFYAVAVLLCWYVIENISVFPHYLAYFNQTVGGPSGGYRYVVDSNLDWGQDLRRFATWVDYHQIKKIEFNYFGWADQSYYMGDHFVWLMEDKYKNIQDFMARNDTDGWIAVSATYLQNNRKTKYAWLADQKPVVVVGNSIFVFHITP